MLAQNSSIQSFFQPEVLSPSHKSHNRPSSKVDTNDGFTSSEVEAELHPLLHQWQPRTTYNEVDIGSLVPGPGCVALMGRVANFYDQVMNSKSPQAAKGCLKVIVKDDSGAFVVLTPSSFRLLCTQIGENSIINALENFRQSYGTPKSTTSSVLDISFQYGPHISPTLNPAL